LVPVYKQEVIETRVYRVTYAVTAKDEAEAENQFYRADCLELDRDLVETTNRVRGEIKQVD
jgi:hypothetical protein